MFDQALRLIERIAYATRTELEAGGYALQGKASVFITSVVGSPSNVIGLPLTETVQLLRAAGVSLPMDRA